MKKILFLFLVTAVAVIHASEQTPFYKFYNSLKSHYNQGDVIYVKNEALDPICIFNQNYFITSDGIKYFWIGIVINPGVTRKIDLTKIVSDEKIETFGAYRYKDVKEFILSPDFRYIKMQYQAYAYIEVASTYIVKEKDLFGNLKIVQVLR